jgi:GH25 family lysozyme M1 (1,4-beta-N-acetylmuramidase)
MAVVSLMPEGIDVASYQGFPNWAEVATEADFVWTKITQGIDYVNPYFEQNWPAIKAAGPYRGSYHFATPDVNTPEPEAEFYWSKMEPVLETGDLLALDFEELDGSFSRMAYGIPVADWPIRFLERLEDLCGFPPVVYLNAYTIQHYNFSQYAERYARYGLWLAAWGTQMPPAPEPWPVIAFWQDSIHSFPGVSGPVDHDYFNGSAGVIPIYGKPEANPTPIPPVPEDPCQSLRLAMANTRAFLREPTPVPTKNWKKKDILTAYAQQEDRITQAAQMLKEPE